MPKKRTKGGSSRAAARLKATKFVAAMLDPKNKGNATQCAIIAGFAEHSAGKSAYKLLQKPEVKEQIERARAEIAEKVGLSVERTLREVARLAYFDPRKLFDEKGQLKPVVDLDDDTAAGLAAIEQYEEFAGKGEGRELIGFTKKVKLADKNSALDKAMKHLGLYEKDNEQHPVPLALPPGTKAVTIDFSKIRERAKAAAKQAR